jgi:hypothetical protein
MATTADTVTKGGCPMSESPLPTLRKEVEDYLRSCEHLISVPVASHQPPFSPDELAMLKYYAAEVVKMLGQLTKV